jgi:hypothetical protein
MFNRGDRHRHHVIVDERELDNLLVEPNRPAPEVGSEAFQLDGDCRGMDQQGIGTRRGQSSLGAHR